MEGRDVPIAGAGRDGDGDVAGKEDRDSYQQHECGARVEVSESVREWEYGDYEGITSKEIAEQRRESGEEEWDIWRDGCPGGEYVFVFHFIVLSIPFPSRIPILKN